jgi:PadR family transcriptional regulator, regulatory protein PadR
MANKTQFLKGCARTLVLKVLSEKPMYGYEIASVLCERSASVFDLGQGTLYPMLYSMEKQGLIRVERETVAPGTGRKRLYYGLTPKGRSVLREDAQTWTSINRGMRLVMGGAHA